MWCFSCFGVKWYLEHLECPRAGWALQLFVLLCFNAPLRAKHHQLVLAPSNKKMKLGVDLSWVVATHAELSGIGLAWQASMQCKPPKPHTFVCRDLHSRPKRKQMRPPPGFLLQQWREREREIAFLTLFSLHILEVRFTLGGASHAQVRLLPHTHTHSLTPRRVDTGSNDRHVFRPRVTSPCCCKGDVRSYIYLKHPCNSVPIPDFGLSRYDGPRKQAPPA